MFKDIIKKFSKIIFGLYVFPLACLTSISKNSEKAVMRSIIKMINRYSKNYIKYSSFPKDINRIDAYNLDNNCDLYRKYGCILQGPLNLEDDFTLNTIILYKKLFPGMQIVVSTWTNEDSNTIDKIRSLDVTVIQNHYPEKRGAGNINLQLKSSYEGALFLNRCGCSYIIKTRTDQRVLANDMLNYFEELFCVFPIRNEYIEKQNERLIFISYGKSYKYLPFGLCDFLVCGKAKDILNYYSTRYNLDWPDDYHKLLKKEEDIFYSYITSYLEPYINKNPYECIPLFNESYFKYMCAECYIAYNYFNKYIRMISINENLYLDYLFFLSQFSIVIDSASLELYWNKYDLYQTQQENSLDYLSKLDFKKWLNIYNSNIRDIERNNKYDFKND